MAPILPSRSLSQHATAPANKGNPNCHAHHPMESMESSAGQSDRASDALFCAACGNLLDLPDSTKEFLHCQQCNHSVRCEDFERLEVVTRSRPQAFGKKNAVVEEEGEEYAGAMIEEKCSKCGHNQMRFFTMQLRSADEGQTVFYTCTRCNYTYSLNS